MRNGTPEAKKKRGHFFLVLQKQHGQRGRLKGRHGNEARLFGEVMIFGILSKSEFVQNASFFVCVG